MGTLSEGITKIDRPKWACQSPSPIKPHFPFFHRPSTSLPFISPSCSLAMNSFPTMNSSANLRHRRFSRPENRKLQKLLEEGNSKLFDEKFYQELTDQFNHAGARSNALKIEVEQVRRWFFSRKRDHVREADSLPTESMKLASVSESSPSGSKEFVTSPESLPGSSKGLIVAPETKVSNNSPFETSSDMPKDTREKFDKDEWEFEARSSKEGAWYDVGEFLSYRTDSAGDPEVRVRFQDFGAEDDEWVDVKTAVRGRSIPLESSDCARVAVGDLVLCFRETKERAAYYDAHIVEIQRSQHENGVCRCLFLVKFDLIQVEGTVTMKDLCRRPVYKSVDGSASNIREGLMGIWPSV